MRPSKIHLPRRPDRPAKPVAVSADTILPTSDPVELRFDGSCSPNPGPMGVGYVINTLAQTGNEDRTRVLVRVGGQVGHGTNNLAEYMALIGGLRHALRLGFWNIVVRSDSQLVVNQMLGVYRVRDKTLKRQWEEAQRLSTLFTSFGIGYVPREQNGEADELSRQLVFEEPTLPALVATAGNNPRPKQLHDWQAAFIRVQTLRGAGAGLLARAFGVHVHTAEQVQYGKSYRDADFSGYEGRFELVRVPINADVTAVYRAGVLDTLEPAQPEDLVPLDESSPAPVCVMRRCTECNDRPREGAADLCVECLERWSAQLGSDLSQFTD